MPTKKATTMAAKTGSRGRNGNNIGGKMTNTGSNSKPTNESAKTTFLTLPPELKNRIYDLALVTSGWPVKIREAQNKFDRGKKVVKKWSRASWREPPILRVCKEIRQEALPLYYGSNNIVIAVFMEDLPSAAAWLGSVLRATGTPTSFLSLTFIVHREAWGKLEQLGPLLKLISEYGQDFARAHGPEATVADAGEPQPPKFEMSRNTGMWIQDAFEDILDLGKQAHDEEWTEEWLDMEFAELLEKHRQTPGGKWAAVHEAKNTRRSRRRAGLMRQIAATTAAIEAAEDDE